MQGNRPLGILALHPSLQPGKAMKSSMGSGLLANWVVGNALNVVRGLKAAMGMAWGQVGDLIT